ncbi:F0F1 ATP synthase subunit delta [Nitrosomonas eutropha]|uniref:ATP synthase subunit b n=2 Tax=Nitrosomonas eutropha TaxID=916 RepID=A0ABX5M7J2_9PROT|nr:F0F1 ATP synthase subunit delta [Nitrosomonas eutropha]ABI60242.1 ATP synthase F0 subcomplex B subunit [Nitrosomonas eutropha C91]PXV81718.1 ATP synthase F0 subcomplex B subunit [Nitrosomonas eutropha]SEI71570.1 ATP synthase F0 subcomplex B subunit [Nitrosomonas eutropha]
MSIDWITVLAQIANFLVLLWLLKRFLYRPILDGIDAREAEIAKRMADAELAQQEAKAAERQYIKQRAQLVSEQDALLEKALQATEKKRDGLLSDARTQLQQEQQNWRKYLEHERQAFNQRLQQTGADALLRLTRKALHDLADEHLEDAIVRHIGQRLKPIAAELVQAAAGSQQAQVTTRDALPAATQALLQKEVQQWLPDVTLSFATDPQQSPGVIMQVGGAQVAWTTDSYMDELAELLTQHTSSVAAVHLTADGR